MNLRKGAWSLRLTHNTVDGTMWLFGTLRDLYWGLYTGEEQSLPITHVWRWDGATWKSASPAPQDSAPMRRLDPAVVYSPGRNATLLIGGEGAVCEEDTESCTPVIRHDTWEWTPAGWYETTARSASPTARSDAKMFHHASRGQTLLFGGGALPYSAQSFTASQPMA